MRQGKFNSTGFDLGKSIQLGDRIKLTVVAEVKEIRSARNRNGEETKTAILAPVEVATGNFVSTEQEESEKLEKVFS